MDSEERVIQEQIERAHEYGLMWLNDVFRFRDQRMTIFRNIRISKLELVWLAVVTVAWVGIAFLLYTLLSWVPYASIILSPFAWFPEGVSLGYFFGRRIPHMSPLRKRTGEGTSIWIVIQFKRGITRLSSWLNQPVTYNRCVTYARNRRQVVECIEWIGTAKAPYMPATDPRVQDWDEENTVHIMPRGRALPYNYRITDLIIEPSQRQLDAMERRQRRHVAKVTKRVERKRGKLDLDEQVGWTMPS